LARQGDEKQGLADLALVSSLLEGMGGRVDVADREGGGSCFTVSLVAVRESVS